MADVDPFAKLWPLAYVAGGIVAGIIVERIFSLGPAAVVRRRWPHAAAGTNALCSAIVLWAFLLGVYAAILNYNLSVESVDLVRKILIGLAVATATYVAGRATMGLIESYNARTSFLPSASLLPTFAELVIFVLGGMMVLSTVGVSITPLLTALGVGGLTIGFALSTPLSNIFAGLLIIASRQLRPGDYVRFDGGVEGWVVDITWFATTLRDRASNYVVMPNAKITSTWFTNFDLPDPNMRVELKATLAADADLDAAERAIVQAAIDTLRSCSIEPQEQPYVRFTDFNGSRINFSAFLRVDSMKNEQKIRHELLKHLQERSRRDPQVLPIFPA
jgi:small-conductance mechanosensitive channel